MRIPRRVAVLAAALSLAAGTGLFTAQADAATVRYVALGDSYSSGDGAGDYSGGNCLRSAHAYAELWAAAHAHESFDFTACSGATTTDVKNDQLGPLNADTTLVSITIGGNDVGFADIMQTCVLQSNSACLDAVDTAKAEVRDELPAKLDSTFSAIDAKAPSARVVVLDYPHLYKIVSFCVGLSNTKRTALNDGADALDEAIAAATSRAGFTFADVRPVFAGHELCSGDGWLHSVTLPIEESYHPTATGQASGYLPALTDAATASRARRSATDRT